MRKENPTKHAEIINSMTSKEKASLGSGADFWHTQPIERLNIPSIMMTDGPHGLRKQKEKGDHIGLNQSHKATCFPTAATTANSWDRELMRQMGEALAKECHSQHVSVLLGPGINIKRSPLCGRNFEYFSEDPFLTGEMANALVSEIEKNGIGTSLKHFAVNSQEYNRMISNSIVDPRALREIYLTAFEIVIKKANPATVMAAYNKVNGIYCCENRFLLDDLLRKQWGFQGVVISDWGATNDRIESHIAGMDLEMPGKSRDNDRKVAMALDQGKLNPKVIDSSIDRLLTLIESHPTHGQPVDQEDHHQLARHIASSSFVLLKNENLLPLNLNEPILIVGSMAENPRYQGSGSSLITPTKLPSLIEILEKENISYTYAKGYDSDVVNPSLIEEAVTLAKSASVVLMMVGLPETYESEGFDRMHLDMPESQNHLITKICEVNKNTVVVLSAGSVVTMPWLEHAGAILHTYLAGQAGSEAIVDVLFGRMNPSGKLAESYPFSLENTPCYTTFAQPGRNALYKESIYVGYRYYDTFQVKTLFPFGYGLSYTTFSYHDLHIEGEFPNLTVTFTIKNTGKVFGSEVVQCYVHHKNPGIFKSNRELKGFDKVHLDPQQKSKVIIQLDARSFSYFNTDISDWVIENGEYEIQIGASIQDIRLRKCVVFDGNTVEVPANFLSQFIPNYYDRIPPLQISDGTFTQITGISIPNPFRKESEFFTTNSTLTELSQTWIGRMFASVVSKQSKKLMPSAASDEKIMKMVQRGVMESPLRSLIVMSNGALSKNIINFLLFIANIGKSNSKA